MPEVNMLEVIEKKSIPHTSAQAQLLKNRLKYPTAVAFLQRPGVQPATCR